MGSEACHSQRPRGPLPPALTSPWGPPAGAPLPPGIKAGLHRACLSPRLSLLSRGWGRLSPPHQPRLPRGPLGGVICKQHGTWISRTDGKLLAAGFLSVACRCVTTLSADTCWVRGRHGTPLTCVPRGRVLTLLRAFGLRPSPHLDEGSCGRQGGGRGANPAPPCGSCGLSQRPGLRKAGKNARRHPGAL